MTSIDVRFSEEDGEWVARSPEYPSLSWVDRNRSVAVLGLLNLLDEIEPSWRPAYKYYTDKPVARTYELGPSVMVDLDLDGEVVGVELLGHDVEFSDVPCPETLASIIRGLEDVKAGRTIPYHEVFADWDNEDDGAGPITWGGVTPLYEWWDES